MLPITIPILTWPHPLSCDSCNDNYKLVAKCCGHSGCISHLDWTLPIALPGTKLNGKMLLMGVDESGNLLFWNPKTGERGRQTSVLRPVQTDWGSLAPPLLSAPGHKVTQNQRDAPMHTWTSRIGFPVMGIWPDATSFDDMNSVCATRRGFPTLDMEM